MGLVVAVRLAIADPPYLGRAATWYGGGQTGTGSTPGRVKGRSRQHDEYHVDAHLWDQPERHHELMDDLERSYDGWALAASAKTLHLIVAAMPDRARIAVWHVTNAIPDGARVRSTWEPVIVRVPEGRRAYGTGLTVPDVLIAPHPMSNFVGSKPAQWTHWVLDMLGHQPGDEITDVFPGSGAVSAAASRLL